MIFASYWAGVELQLWQSLAVVALSFLPSWLSYRCVESPLRRAEVLQLSGIAISVGLGLMAVALFSATLICLQVS